MQDVVFFVALARNCNAVIFNRAFARKVSSCHTVKQWQSFLSFASCVSDVLYKQGFTNCYTIANRYRCQAMDALAQFTQVARALWQIKTNGKTYLPCLKGGSL